MTQHSIPDVVRAQIGSHLADVRLNLAQVRDELDAVPVTTSRSRALRRTREQLTAQAEAWEYLSVMVADSAHYPACRACHEVNE